ncbi:MAG: hypothetical protein ACE5HL_11890 [Terriglobia bacterium]
MRIQVVLLAVALWTGIMVAPQGVQAEGIPTKVMVRAFARDAKAIADAVSGARITIRDVATGTVLAEGIQKGKSGSTELIMNQPRERGAMVFNTPGTAGFQATLMLERPTVVEVTAEGPLGAPQAMQRASKTLLLVPGQDVLGEGILLEIHGYIVELESPASDFRPTAGERVEVRAKVTMA